MRTPNHTKASRIAEDRTCPECDADLEVTQTGAYIDCVSNDCGWLGWSYEYVGAVD